MLIDITYTQRNPSNQLFLKSSLFVNSSLPFLYNYHTITIPQKYKRMGGVISLARIEWFYIKIFLSNCRPFWSIVEFN